MDLGGRNLLKNAQAQVKQVKGSRSFYLWGFLPQEHIVLLDEELSKVGFISASEIEIEQQQSFLNRLYTVLTLGFYKPIDYQISARGIVSYD